jgi:hypothetical protein
VVIFSSEIRLEALREATAIFEPEDTLDKILTRAEAIYNFLVKYARVFDEDGLPF